MSEHKIRTVDDLLNSISDLEFLGHTGSLEQYLRGLWKTIQEHHGQTVTLPLIKEILEKAAVTEPTPFNEAWLKFENPPFDKDYEKKEDGDFAYLKHTILFQIADLHRMKEAGTLGLGPVVLYGGVDSPSGNRWYNFTVGDYFECAIAGYESHCKSYHVRNEWTDRFASIGRPLDSTVFTWRDLAEILELGRVYE